MKRVIISMALLTGIITFAGGFRVSLQGVKQLAMAHTSAHAEDASVTFFNPAGMSFIPSKLSIVGGGFGIQSKVIYQNTSTLQNYETDNPIGTPFYFAVAGKPLENLSLGLNIATPYGSSVKWEDDWAGKEILQNIELKSIYFQPMISIKLAPWASVGASYIYAMGTVEQNKAITQLNGNLNIKDDKAKGHGFGLGFYFQPDNYWDVSLAYRSAVDLNAENGLATFNVSSSLFSTLGLDANGQDKFTATLPLVDEFTLGATYKVTPKWKISADFNYAGWERYENLTLDFENAKVGNQTDVTVLRTPKNFKNTKTFRLGTEYQVTPKVAGRLGWYFDESPYEDKWFTPETPSFDANVFTAGVGFNFGKFGVDVAAAKSFPKARSFNNKYYNFAGQATAKPFFFGLGFSYNLK